MPGLFSLLCPLALAAPDGEIGNAELLALAAKAPKAGYVFLLDTSAPLEPTSEGLRTEIAALVSAAPAGDSVEIIAFHSRPYVALPRTEITEAGRAALAASIVALDLPASYDRDLGAGLDQLAKSLNAENRPRHVHVFVVSNFCHAPNLFSPWSSGGRGCSPIRNQAEIGGQVAGLLAADGASLHYLPVQTPQQAVDPAGIEAARREFGGTLHTEAPNVYLAAWRGRLPLERVRPLAERDLRKPGFTVSLLNEPTADDPVATLKLTSTTGLLDLSIDDLRVTNGGAGVPTTVALNPSVELRVPLTLPPAPFSLVRAEQTVNVNMTVAGKARLEPATALTMFEPATPGKLPEQTITVPVKRTYGLAPALTTGMVVGVLCALAGLALLARARFVPVRLSGRLYARHSGGPRQPLDISDLKEAGVAVAEDGSARLSQGNDAVFVLRVRRPLWKLHSEIEVRKPGFELNGRPVPVGVHPVVAGAASLKLAEWRFSWE